MRRLSSFSLVAVLAATSFVGASTASAATKSPAEVLQLSVSAMHSAGSFHYQSTA
jgi:hypothetical protein